MDQHILLLVYIGDSGKVNLTVNETKVDLTVRVLSLGSLKLLSLCAIVQFCKRSSQRSIGSVFDHNKMVKCSKIQCLQRCKRKFTYSLLHIRPGNIGLSIQYASCVCVSVCDCVCACVCDCVCKWKVFHVLTMVATILGLCWRRELTTPHTLTPPPGPAFTSSSRRSTATNTPVSPAPVLQHNNTS